MENQIQTEEFSTTAVEKTTAFVNKNKKILYGVLAAIIIIVGGAYAYYTLVAQPNEEKANYLLSKGQTYFGAGNFDIALNGDKADYKGFVDIAKKYSGTDAGNLANLYAGLCYSEKGDSKNAVKYLEEFSTKGDALISPAAIAALGNNYVKEGDLDKAIDLLKKAAAKADNNSLSPIFLKQAALILESQNKKAEALKLYEEIKSNYPEAVETQNIDKYIERVSE